MMDSEASLDTRRVFAPRYHRHHMLSHQGHLGALGTAEQFPSHCPLPHEKEHQVRMGMDYRNPSREQYTIPARTGVCKIHWQGKLLPLLLRR